MRGQTEHVLYRSKMKTGKYAPDIAWRQFLVLFWFKSFKSTWGNFFSKMVIQYNWPFRSIYYFAQSLAFYPLT